MALTDMESSPILGEEEEVTIVPSQRRRRNVQVVLLYAVGFVAAVLGVYVGAPMKMIRVATWASTVKLWSNSGTITNSGNGNVVGDKNNLQTTNQQGDVSSTSTDDHSVHINYDNRKDRSSTDSSIHIGGSVHGSVGDNNRDSSITNRNIHDAMVKNGPGQQKSCEGSGNDGSGAGAVGTVCCASLTGEVSCDHASSGDHVIKAMSKLKNSDTVTKSDKLRKTFDEKCEHTMKDLISDQKKLDLALMVVCKAHAAEPTLLAELTPGCEWIPQDNCVNDDFYACKCRRENPAWHCTACESAGGSRPKASGRYM